MRVNLDGFKCSHGWKTTLPGDSNTFLQPNMGPELWFKNTGLCGTFSASGSFKVNYTQSSACFCCKPAVCVTVIKQQSVNLWLCFSLTRWGWRGSERGGGSERGEKKTHCYSLRWLSCSHMALIETHSYIHDDRRVHAHRRSSRLLCLSLLVFM